MRVKLNQKSNLVSCVEGQNWHKIHPKNINWGPSIISQLLPSQLSTSSVVPLHKQIVLHRDGFICSAQSFCAMAAASLSFHPVYSRISSLPTSSQHQTYVSLLSHPPFTSRCSLLTVGYRQKAFGFCSVTRIRSPSPLMRANASVNREPMMPPYNVLITGSTKGPFLL